MPAKLLVIGAIILSALAFSGCETANRDESNIPWNRPASWEGGPAGYGDQLPGRERY